MKGHKDKLKSGFEYDVVQGRAHYGYLHNHPGVTKKGKKQINKRDRKKVRRLIKEGKLDLL